ncbi:hypothetical protein [Rhodococcus fascians]|uniref:hypothetical protein n=1 Tax=Rhodococcoides fascians TaxID=1828 RepID=UPI000B31E9A6|nr:hypothetical protein [Rhodococcus fascians]
MLTHNAFAVPLAGWADLNSHPEYLATPAKLAVTALDWGWQTAAVRSKRQTR